MPANHDASRTIRIDLLPDVPNRPIDAMKQRVVIGRPDQRDAGLEHETPGERSHYQRLLQRLYDAAVIADLDGRIVDVNLRAEDFFGFSKPDLRQRTIFDLISGADEALIQTLCGNLEGERFTLIQAYCFRSDASIFPAEIAVSKLDLGQLHLCFFVRDITVRKQAEEMLITEHNALQNSGNGIAIVDKQGALEYVNPMVEQMWGSEADALLGNTFGSLMAAQDDADEVVRALVQGDDHRWTGEVQAKRLDGTLFDIQVSGTRNRNPEGETLGCVFSFVDISDRKRADKVERELEQRRVMLESLGAACHHVGQPATMVLGTLELLKDRLKDADEETGALIERSLNAMEQLSQVLRKLTTVSEYETTQYLGDEDGEDGQGSRILKI